MSNYDTIRRDSLTSAKKLTGVITTRVQKLVVQ